MSSARAQANHKLYLARIQLQAWREASAAQEIPVLTLTQAFLPAVRAHLQGAYGWFLLALSGIDTPPDDPPRCCAELPETAAGKAVPGEIREFEQLEADGWLAELLTQDGALRPATRSRGNLAAAAPDLPDLERAATWAERLEELFQRMGDSLDEF